MPGAGDGHARVAVDDYVEQGRNIGADRFAIGVAELIGMFDADAASAHGFRHLGEIRVPQLARAFIDEARADFTPT